MTATHSVAFRQANIRTLETHHHTFCVRMCRDDIPGVVLVIPYTHNIFPFQSHTCGNIYQRKTRKRCAARAVAYQTCCMRYDAGWTAPQRIPPRRRDRGAQHPNRKPAASDKLHTPAEMSEADPPDRAAGKVRSRANPIEDPPFYLVTVRDVRSAAIFAATPLASSEYSQRWVSLESIARQRPNLWISAMLYPA